ncbi:MAG: S-layer homology domain-containing protein [Clostridia bacterium]|nr:S-layer homology domain-containing protein [Clostridia bacterium]
MKNIIKLALCTIVIMMCTVTVVSAADDHLVLDASKLAQSLTVSDSAFLSESIAENGKAYVKFTTPETGTAADGTQIEFNFSYTKYTEGYPAKEYPIVRIGYKSDIKGEKATLDLNYGLDYLGKATRVWGYAPSYDKSGNDASLIFDIRDVFSGGENISDYSYDSIDADTVCNYLRLKPYNRTARVEGETFSIEYIGFFKTREDAEKYMHKIEDKITELKPSFGYYKLAQGESFDLGVTCLPTYASVSGVKYSSADTSIATVDENGKVTATGKGKVDITVSADGTDAAAVTHVIVEENKPLDIYAKDFEGGKKVVVNVLGDSISADSARNELSAKYHGIWAGTFNMDVNNWSRGGSAVTGNITNENDRLETYVPRMERMIANDITSYDTVTSSESPDLIFIYGGTNDYNGNWKIGEPTDRTRNTYMGAISELIEMAYANYPDAKLVFFTPIKRCDYSDKPGYDNSGTRSYELDVCVEAMKEICEVYNVTCIDVYNNDQTELIGFRSLYITDGVHMSAAGHRIFAAVAVEEMEKAGVIKTHGYTAPAAITRTLSASRSLNADYYLYTAAQLNGRARYDNSTALDRQRMTKHEYTDGALRFKAETLSSSLAPTISVNLNSFSFSATDYPYMTVVYKTSSNAEKINVKLRGNNNRMSAIEESRLPALVSGEKAAFTVNIRDFENDAIKFAEDSIYTDLYYTLGFFNSTKEMNAESYVDIIAIGFFKNEDVAKSYDGEKVKGSGFTDTIEHWACDSIDYVVRRGLFSGVTKTEFKPNDKMTRGMLVTVLSRLAEDTENKTTFPYKDVDAGAWFAPGVSFAYANGIIDAGDSFRPDDSITREEIADMLYRYAKKTGKKLGSAELNFADADQIAADKREAIAYCVYAGIIKGYEDNTVNPKGLATRAEVSALLERFAD